MHEESRRWLGVVSGYVVIRPGASPDFLPRRSFSIGSGPTVEARPGRNGTDSNLRELRSTGHGAEVNGPAEAIHTRDLDALGKIVEVIARKR